MAEKAVGKKVKICFVVSPIGEEGSPIRDRADWLFEYVIAPVLTNRGYECKRADHIATPGLIDFQIINLLQTADLVIADLTEPNPNVFYEIGIRHCYAKPIIHMFSGDARIPFDVSMYRAVNYSLANPKGISAAKVALEAQVVETEVPGYQPRTPVQATVSYEVARESVPTAQANKAMLDFMTQLSSRIAVLEENQKELVPPTIRWSQGQGKSRWISKLLYDEVARASIGASSSEGIAELLDKQSLARLFEKYAGEVDGKGKAAHTAEEREGLPGQPLKESVEPDQAARPLVDPKKGS